MTTTRRGTSNTNVRGSAENRRRRRQYLVDTYRADVTILRVTKPNGEQYEMHVIGDVTKSLELCQAIGRDAVAIPACRCYRCGDLLTVDTVTSDRIIPGCLGGTYRRENIRPCCVGCNSSTGGALGYARKIAAVKS